MGKKTYHPSVFLIYLISDYHLKIRKVNTKLDVTMRSQRSYVQKGNDQDLRCSLEPRIRSSTYQVLRSS